MATLTNAIEVIRYSVVLTPTFRKSPKDVLMRHGKLVLNFHQLKGKLRRSDTILQ
jgi:hypothetical protein